MYSLHTFINFFLYLWNVDMLYLWRNALQYSQSPDYKTSCDSPYLTNQIEPLSLCTTTLVLFVRLSKNCLWRRQSSGAENGFNSKFSRSTFTNSWIDWKTWIAGHSRSEKVLSSVLGQLPAFFMNLPSLTYTGNTLLQFNSGFINSRLCTNANFWASLLLLCFVGITVAFPPPMFMYSLLAHRLRMRYMTMGGTLKWKCRFQNFILHNYLAKAITLCRFL